MSALKTINYRGGLVIFSIPATWREEYEPAGGGTFYEDRPDSGTLRLNVMTMEAPPYAQELSALQALSHSTAAGDEREVTALPNGNAMARYVKKAVEDRQRLHIHYWEVASPLPPRHMRLAIFSYTLFAAQTSTSSVRRELEMLNQQIEAAQFASELGVVDP